MAGQSILRAIRGWISQLQKANRPKRSRCLKLEPLEDRSLLSALADLTAFRPINPYINAALHAVPEAVEENLKLGPGIRINGDDDNANRNPDYDDNSTAAAGDNDLVQVNVAGEGDSLTVAWTGALKLWTTPTKTAEVQLNGPVSNGQSLWVEYTSQTHTVGADTALTLTASEDVSGTTTIATDTVVFHSFQSLVVAIGGNSQDPRNVGDPRLGIFTIASTLYDSGYDVQLFAHNQIQSNGHGAAYDEVTSAVLNRNVDYVGILGYSWGAGATYELAKGLAANGALAPAGYHLQYTAYVDGIRHYSLRAETRKPVATQYHDNYYQRKDWLLRGNNVSGANNVNVTKTTWGKQLVHTTIDDNATLQSQLVNNLKARVTA